MCQNLSRGPLDILGANEPRSVEFNQPICKNGTKNSLVVFTKQCKKQNSRYISLRQSGVKRPQAEPELANQPYKGVA